MQGHLPGGRIAIGFQVDKMTGSLRRIRIAAHIRSRRLFYQVIPILIKEKSHLFRQLINGQLVDRPVYQEAPTTAGQNNEQWYCHSEKNP